MAEIKETTLPAERTFNISLSKAELEILQMAILSLFKKERTNRLSQDDIRKARRLEALNVGIAPTSKWVPTPQSDIEVVSSNLYDTLTGL